MKTFLEFVSFVAIIAGGTLIHPGLGLICLGLVGAVAVNALERDS